MFGGGGGGLDPRKMKQMMDQMGIDMTDIDAREIVIRTPDGELYFDDAEVQVMEAQGQKTYQIVGEPEERESTDAPGGGSGTSGSTGPEEAGGTDAIPEEDVDLVATRAGVDPAAARDALEAAGGDLAAAVERLE